MEEIIGLLVVLAIGIFKSVGKKLEKAGTPAAPAAPAPSPSAPEADESPFDVKGWIAEAVRELAEEKARPVMQTKPVRKPGPVNEPPQVHENVVRQTPAKPILEEPQKKAPMERIDPKKLMLYSEIMKPKFNE